VRGKFQISLSRIYLIIGARSLVIKGWLFTKDVSTINPNVAKKTYNPADRNAGKAFQRPPSYVEDGNSQHMIKVTFSKPR
jgi:hypothetical protein